VCVSAEGYTVERERKSEPRRTTQNYQRHLFQERQIRSVTANTRDDAHAFLRFAEGYRLRVTTTEYSLDDADQALLDLATGHVRGAAVLVP
jgi:propanol-preferring alcohol dehydrogenase